MRRDPITIALCGVLIAVTVATVNVAATTPSTVTGRTMVQTYAQQRATVQRPKNWALTMDFRGESYVLDHGLTMGDCWDAMPRNQTDKGLHFACERKD